jgi:hypothetical protein
MFLWLTCEVLTVYVSCYVSGTYCMSLVECGTHCMSVIMCRSAGEIDMDLEDSTTLRIEIDGAMPQCVQLPQPVGDTLQCSFDVHCRVLSLQLAVDPVPRRLHSLSLLLSYTPTLTLTLSSPLCIILVVMMRSKEFKTSRFTLMLIL